MGRVAQMSGAVCSHFLKPSTVSPVELGCPLSLVLSRVDFCPSFFRQLRQSCAQSSRYNPLRTCLPRAIAWAARRNCPAAAQRRDRSSNASQLLLQLCFFLLQCSQYVHDTSGKVLDTYHPQSARLSGSKPWPLLRWGQTRGILAFAVAAQRILLARRAAAFWPGPSGQICLAHRSAHGSENLVKWR